MNDEHDPRWRLSQNTTTVSVHPVRTNPMRQPNDSIDISMSHGSEAFSHRLKPKPSHPVNSRETTRIYQCIQLRHMRVFIFLSVQTVPHAYRVHELIGRWYLSDDWLRQHHAPCHPFFCSELGQSLLSFEHHSSVILRHYHFPHHHLDKTMHLHKHGEGT